MNQDAERARVEERYRLEEELARTWSGVVWRAHDLARDTPVAFKRFELEAPAPLERRLRFLGQLDALTQAPAHPHLGGVEDAIVQNPGD